jgi:opacity protein-like surface antigen
MSPNRCVQPVGSLEIEACHRGGRRPLSAVPSNAAGSKKRPYYDLFLTCRALIAGWRPHSLAERPVGVVHATPGGGVRRRDNRRRGAGVVLLEVIMRGKLIAALVIVLAAAAPAVWAQPCSIQTVTGTYAVQVTGRSASGTLNVPYSFYELQGGQASLVGQVTIAPSGAYTGTYWGVYVMMPIQPTPFAGWVSVNPDCTINDSGTDKGVVIDNGKEIRFITWQGGGTNISTWYRMSPANGQGPSCGQQTFSGTYMERCEGYSFFSLGEAQLPGVATSTSLLLYSARDGVLTGTYRGKVFGYPNQPPLVESALSATYTVNPDCTIEKVYSLGFLPPGYVIKSRGALFDEGRQGVGLPMGVYDRDGYPVPAMPVGPLTCQTVRLSK